MSIYDNEKPFGLMSEEYQKAMKAHYDNGGEIQIYRSSGR